MPDRPLDSVIQHLRRVVRQDGGGELTDAQLLDNFVRRRDEAAFELLVWRHAALVLGTCRRLLHDRHEAEDAFQATFLVLVRKAASISKRESVGSWLYKVACRIAGRARSRSAKRACCPLPGDLPARADTDEVLWRDLRPVLDEEVARLPEKYRRPFVLCYLEGHTNEQAARQLGCPTGTVLSRLARGRERLRQRLARRGLVLSGGLLAALLPCAAAEAALPAALVKFVVKAAVPYAAGKAAAELVSARAAAWTAGVLQAMFLTKLKIASAVVLVVALVATGVGLVGPSLLADPGPAPARQKQRPAEPTRDGRPATPAPEVRGLLKSVDADKGTITVSLNPREEGSEKSFTLAKNAEVGINTGLGRRGGVYHEGKLSDLAPGALVLLQLSADQKVVECVLAEGPTVQGLIKSVDAGKGTITLTGAVSRRDSGDDEKTFNVAKDAEIALDDGRGKAFSIKEARLADLPPGAVATLKLSADGKQVRAILTEGPTVQGTVKAVDAAKGQLTLTTRVAPPTREREATSEERTYTVAPAAEVLLDDGKPRRFPVSKQSKLADVPAGAVAMLKLTPDQSQAVLLRAEGPGVYGLLKAVDPKKNTITVTLRPARGDDPGEEKTFAVAADARLLIEGKEGKLADLKPEENGPPVALKLSLDQKTVQSITVGGGRR
jgi:RNA polymerase sigma factor (sigma-70 family)